ncbi:MAG: DUF1800 family protein [Planctomycetota bacterium]
MNRVSQRSSLTEKQETTRNHFFVTPTSPETRQFSLKAYRQEQRIALCLFFSAKLLTVNRMNQPLSRRSSRCVRLGTSRFGLAEPIQINVYSFRWRQSTAVPLFGLFLLGASVASDLAAGTFEVTDATQIRALRARAHAVHFLSRATFGPRESEVTELAQRIQQVGTRRAMEEWIDQQFALPASLHVETVESMMQSHGIEYDSNEDLQRYRYHAFYHIALDAPDQLRQRVAWALSQIFVIGDNQITFERELNPDGIPNWFGVSGYYDLMVRGAGGQYRDLLEDVALHPVMGIYLSHLANQKADPERNIFPDENFAREIMQLFSIGLYELNEDGRPKLDGEGNLIPTYDNSTIQNFARVFTGLNYSRAQFFGWGQPRDFISRMEVWEQYHDTEPKTLLRGLTLPARSGAAGDGMKDIQAALDNLASHENVAPFISRQLIQRLVRSNPSRGYIKRVARVFDSSGGNFRDVVKAILLDSEAFRSYKTSRLRDPLRVVVSSRGTDYTRLREPILHYLSIFRTLEPEIYYNGVPSEWSIIRPAQEDFSQAPFGSPSVFNFYLPAYRPPGILAEANAPRRLPDRKYVAPEFQLLTSVLSNRRSNLLRHQMYQGVIEFEFWSPSGNHIPGRVEFDFSRWLDLLDSDPESIVDELNWLFCKGQLEDSSRAAIVESLERISAEQPWLSRQERLGPVIYFVLVSPECMVTP